MLGDLLDIFVPFLTLSGLSPFGLDRNNQNSKCFSQPKFDLCVLGLAFRLVLVSPAVHTLRSRATAMLGRRRSLVAQHHMNDGYDTENGSKGTKASCEHTKRSAMQARDCFRVLRTRCRLKKRGQGCVL